MSESYQHKCIKISCKKAYSDTDPDPYYCPECKNENAKIAKEIEAKLASMPKKERKSDLQRYDELRKLRGTAFININEL